MNKLPHLLISFVISCQLSSQARRGKASLFSNQYHLALFLFGTQSVWHLVFLELGLFAVYSIQPFLLTKLKCKSLSKPTL